MTHLQTQSATCADFTGRKKKLVMNTAKIFFMFLASILATTNVTAASEQIHEFPMFADSRQLINAQSFVDVDGRSTLEVVFSRELPQLELLRVGFRGAEGNLVWLSLDDLNEIGIAAMVLDERTVQLEMPGDWQVVRVSMNGEEVDVSEVAITSEAMSSKAGCAKECTTYVWERTKISFQACWNRPYGDAGYWFEFARKCKFGTSSTPRANSILELFAPNIGHVVYVTSVKLLRTGIPFANPSVHEVWEVVFSDANWGAKECRRDGVKQYYQNGNLYSNYDNRTNRLSGVSYRANGFITSWTKK